MKNQSIYILFTLGTLLVNSPSVFAQPLNSPTSDGEFQSNEQDANGSSFGNSFKPLDLIHRVNLSNGRDAEEFNNDSAVNINNAASEFKKLQLEKLQNQQPESSNNSVGQ